LLTAPEDPTPSPANDEPVRFVTDPNGRGYGSGMVARGGTADYAEHAVPVPAVASPAPAAKPGLVFADKLSRQPSLGSADPCRGFFPQSAHSNRGQVSVIATVRDQGSIARVEIESETPAGQGFGAAARACLSKQRFEPALDDAGKPTAARTRIRISFDR
jgi:TonB family protein